VTLSVDYPDRPLNRMTTFLAVPILILVGTVAGGSWSWGGDDRTSAVGVGVGGLSFLGPLLMIVFRRT
jgi:hypothetical protein